MNPLPWLEALRGRYTVVRRLFPRLLAVFCLLAFVSWGVQYDGLVGAGVKNDWCFWVVNALQGFTMP